MGYLLLNWYINVLQIDKKIHSKIPDHMQAD